MNNPMLFTRERVHPVTRKHSFLSPKCEANNHSQIHRYGVFAKEDIKRGELIALWGGYIITSRKN